MMISLLYDSSDSNHCSLYLFFFFDDLPLFFHFFLIVFFVFLHFFLEVINQILGLPQSVDQSVVENQLSHVLKLFSDLVSRLASPRFVLALLFPQFFKFGFIVILHFLIFILELSHKSFLDAIDDADHVFGSVGNVVVLFGCFFQKVK